MFLVLAAVLVILFWRNLLLLSLLIILLAIAKHHFLPIKRELLWFIVIGFLGSSFENFIIYSGAWNYPIQTIMNIPFWLPFLWGISGTTVISLYSALVENKKTRNL